MFSEQCRPFPPYLRKAGPADGQTNGWMVGWWDGRMDRRMDGQMDGLMNMNASKNVPSLAIFLILFKSGLAHQTETDRWTDKKIVQTSTNSRTEIHTMQTWPWTSELIVIFGLLTTPVGKCGTIGTQGTNGTHWYS